MARKSSASGCGAGQVTQEARLRRAACALALFSLVYCAAEGALSVVFAALDKQVSLAVFGVDSLIEVVSACMVLWRLLGRAVDLKREFAATVTIGGLLVLLFCAALGASVAGLLRREHPETTTFGIAVSGAGVVVLTAMWLAKRTLARSLNSSALAADAVCSLACARLSLVLLTGSAVYKAHSSTWWADAAAALVLSLFFLKEGVQLIRHALSPSFSGGGCGCG